VPSLNPEVEITVEHRNPTYSKAARQSAGGGRETASERPTTKLWVGHIAEHATLDTLNRVFGV